MLNTQQNARGVSFTKEFRSRPSLCRALETNRWFREPYLQSTVWVRSEEIDSFNWKESNLKRTAAIGSLLVICREMTDSNSEGQSRNRSVESDWDDYLDANEYSINHPLGGDLKAIEIREDEVDSELLSKCVKKYIVPEVSKGYYITHEDIENHQEVINEHGIEAYLEKRLEEVKHE